MKKILMILIIAVAVIACDDDNGVTDPVTDPALNGSWLKDGTEIRFNNGNGETFINNGNYFCKWAYTTKDGQYISNTTDIHGSWSPSLGLENRWYSRQEYQTKVSGSGNTYGGLTLDSTYNYTVSGNTLTTTDVNGGITQTWTRKK